MIDQQATAKAVQRREPSDLTARYAAAAAAGTPSQSMEWTG